MFVAGAYHSPVMTQPPYKPPSEHGTLSRASSMPNGDTVQHREVTVDVEYTKARPHRRQPGEVPYPVRLTSDVREFEIWDHNFLMGLLHGDMKSLAEVYSNPKRVLDLGCGVGSWVLDAAKVWPEATLIGFDISNIQPNLRLLGDAIGESVKRRVSWIHGNFLERLPFDDEEFDLVRMARIGLGVPEDEWQDVIEEIHRILKPGGHLEVIEEDIIFPCPKPPTSTIDEGERMVTPTPHYLGNSSSNDDLQKEREPVKARSYADRPRQSIDLQASLKRNHTVIKDAYNAIFQDCFINVQVLTILPFYLQTTFSTQLTTYPVVNIYMPSPSVPERHIADYHAGFRNSSDSVTLVEDSLNGSTSVRGAQLNGDCWPDFVPPREEFIDMTTYHTHMHLRKVVANIVSCKEAIWEQYERLHRHERLPPNPALDREDFEGYFRNWECDMMDRIGMRDVLRDRMGMKEPVDTEMPDWKIWRDKQAEIDGFDISSVTSRGEPTDLCRNLRAFICRKAGGEIATATGKPSPLVNTPSESTLSSSSAESPP